MFDETDYNNGVAPKSGLVWNGETWGWPTVGISTGTIREETLTVWPKTNALSLQEYIDLMTGSGSFDPKTGNGWVPAVDGMSEPAPEVQRTETKSALNKIKSSFVTPQGNVLMSANFWSFGVANQEVTEFTTINPVITMIPAKLLTDTVMKANSSAPQSVQVHSRILDEVHNGKQHLAVVGSKTNTYTIPVVQAKTLGKNYFVGRMPGPLSFLEFYITDSGIAEQKKHALATPEDGQLRQAGATVGQRTDDVIVWFPVGSNREPLYVSFTRVLTANGLADRVQKEKTAEKELQDAVKLVADFYKEITAKFGEQQAKIAEELAKSAKGKRIRSAEDAIKSFDKYKDSINSRFSVKDREAIARALNSLDRARMSRDLARYSKGLGGVSYFIDGLALAEEYDKSVQTGNWKPFFVKAESVGAGMFATELVGFTFAFLTGTPLGILSFAIIMLITTALIDEKLMEKIHDQLFK